MRILAGLVSAALAACAAAHQGGDDDGPAPDDAGVDADRSCTMACDMPPPATCVDPMTARSFGAGTCVDGACQYAPTDTACARGCDDGACRFDPATCPVGVADGCCGLQGQGGTDPDCPSLDCELQVGARIAFDDIPLPVNYERGGVGMVWTGDRLVTARIDQAVPPADMYRYVLEYRDAAGAIVERHEAPCPQAECGSAVGPVKLAHEPTSDRFMLAFPGQGGHRYTILDADGTRRSSVQLGVNCIPSRAQAGVYTHGGEFVAVWDDDSCDSTSARGAGMRRISVDGTLGFAASPVGSTNITTFACGANCDRVAWFYANNNWELQVASHELATFQTSALTLSASMYGGSQYSAMAFDGTRFFVVVHEWPTPQTGQRLRMQYLDPITGWIGAPVLDQAGDAQWQPTNLVWTGQGFMMAISTLANMQCNGGTQCRAERRIELLRFDTTGAIRQRINLDNQLQGALVPQLAWVRGRLALTWVSSPQQGPERRFLTFLSCAAP